MVGLELEKYMESIEYEATVALRKIKQPSIYELEDLIQEGLCVFFKLKNNFDSERAMFSTFFITCLKNRFYDVVEKSYRSVDPETEEKAVPDNTVDMIYLEEKISKLPYREYCYVDLCINPDEEMVRELQRCPLCKRVILRKVMKLTDVEENEIRNKIKMILVEV